MARRAASISRAVMRARLGGLQAVLAEGDGAAALREAGVAALELLAVLGSLGLHHGADPQLPLRPRPQAGGSGAGAAASAASAGATASGWSNTSPLKIHTLTPITP